MDWIIKAANEQNAERHRRQTIARNAPTVWANVCDAIEQAVRFYRALDSAVPVEFSGCANHTIWVATFHEIPVRRERGPERERVTMTLNGSVIETRRNDVVKSFPMCLNAAGFVCLMDGDNEISPEKFTEMVLRDLFFPD